MSIPDLNNAKSNRKFLKYSLVFTILKEVKSERNSQELLKPYQPGKGALEAIRNCGLIYDWLEEILDDVASAHPRKVRAIDEVRIKTDKITAAYR